MDAEAGSEAKQRAWSHPKYVHSAYLLGQSWGHGLPHPWVMGQVLVSALLGCNSIWLLYNGYTNLHPYQEYTSVSFLHALARTFYLLPIDKHHSYQVSGDVSWFWFAFLGWLVILTIYLLTMSSLKESLTRSFVHF